MLPQIYINLVINYQLLELFRLLYLKYWHAFSFTIKTADIYKHSYLHQYIVTLQILFILHICT